MDLVKILTAALLLANVYATVRLVRADLLSNSTKAAQLALVWLLPIIGAVICISFLTSQAIGPGTLAASERSDMIGAGDLSPTTCADFGGCGDTGGDGE